MEDKATSNEHAALMHWSEFGQKGEPPKERIGPPTKKTEPFEIPITSTWDQIIPWAEVPKLLNGFRPMAMEDKWYVYAEGPDARGHAIVHLSRSWTGYKIADVKLAMPLNGKGGVVADADARFTEITWESSPARHNNQTERGLKEMVVNVFRWCMDVSLP